MISFWARHTNLSSTSVWVLLLLSFTYRTVLTKEERIEWHVTAAVGPPVTEKSCFHWCIVVVVVVCDVPFSTFNLLLCACVWLSLHLTSHSIMQFERIFCHSFASSSFSSAGQCQTDKIATNLCCVRHSDSPSRLSILYSPQMNKRDIYVDFVINKISLSPHSTHSLILRAIFFAQFQWNILFNSNMMAVSVHVVSAVAWRLLLLLSLSLIIMKPPTFTQSFTEVT